MKSLGIFEAKTHFPGISDEIVASGTPVTTSRVNAQQNPSIQIQ
jgi:hypothetical protein